MPSVVVVGSLMIDLVSNAAKLPAIGETVIGDRFFQTFGGKGANQCVQSARLGTSSAMIGKLGRDSFGALYRRHLQSERNLTTFLSDDDDLATGVASIWVHEASGHNSIIIVPGANSTLTPMDVRALEQVIAGADIVVTQLEVSEATTLEALRLAKKHGIRSIFNPAPCRPNLSEELFRLADIVCPNEVEAEQITGVPIREIGDSQRALDRLFEMGCQTAIITLGERGVVYATSESPRYCHVAAERVDTVVDTTGAGDSFVGSLASILTRGIPLADALDFACRIATISTQKRGTQPSFARCDELPEALRRILTDRQ